MAEHRTDERDPRDDARDPWQEEVASSPETAGDDRLADEPGPAFWANREDPEPDAADIAQVPGIGPRTAAAVKAALDEALSGRTSLVIAHRLSTVRQADCIHLMEGGRIVESGTHDALLGLGGGYAALWRLQTGERG